MFLSFRYVELLQPLVVVWTDIEVKKSMNYCVWFDLMENELLKMVTWNKNVNFDAKTAI